MRPMPSPLRTNQERLFLRDGPILMAMDAAAPGSPERMPAAMEGLLERLKALLPGPLYLRVAADLAGFYDNGEFNAGARTEAAFRKAGASPAQVARLAGDGAAAEAIAQDLEDLEGKISPGLFAKLKEALIEHYRTEMEEDLDRVDEQLNQPMGGMDSLSPRVRRAAAELAGGIKRLKTEEAARLLPALGRIKVLS